MNNSIQQAAVSQVIRQVVNSWAAQNKTVTDVFGKYADETYLNEVAPGRNRAIYLLGHLIATSDGMIPLFGIGEKLFPHLEPVFSANPDKTIAEIPAIAELRSNWETLNQVLKKHFDRMEPEAWLERHTKVSEEEFAIDPLRNKLNVLLGRVAHQSYHIGQLAFLVEA